MPSLGTFHLGWIPGLGTRACQGRVGVHLLLDKGAEHQLRDMGAGHLLLGNGAELQHRDMGVGLPLQDKEAGLQLQDMGEGSAVAAGNSLAVIGLVFVMTTHRCR